MGRKKIIKPCTETYATLRDRFMHTVRVPMRTKPCDYQETLAKFMLLIDGVVNQCKTQAFSWKNILDESDKAHEYVEMYQAWVKFMLQHNFIVRVGLDANEYDLFLLGAHTSV